MAGDAISNAHLSAAPVGGPVLGSPVSPAGFDQSDLLYYANLQRQIAQSESTNPVENLSRTRQAHDLARGTLSAAQKSLAERRAEVDKLTLTVGKLSEPSFFAKAFGCASASKLQKATESLESARSAAKSQSTRAEEATREAEAVNRSQLEWETKAAELERLQNTRQSRLDAFFASPAWSTDATLAGTQQEAFDADGRSAESRGYAGTFASAEGYLKQAQKHLAMALRLLEQAGFMGRVNMGMDIGRRIDRPMAGRNRSMMGPMLQGMEMRRANELTQAAAQAVGQAQTLVPSLPYIERGLIDTARRGMFVALLGGNFLGEMVIMQQVRQGAQNVMTMGAQIKECVVWCSDNAAAHSNAGDTAAAAASDARARMQSYKISKVHEALSALEHQTV